MNYTSRIAAIGLISMVGLAACGSDAKVNQPLATTVMTEDTAVMTEDTTAMTEDTTAMTESTPKP